MAAQELFDELAAEHLGRPGVTLGRVFHNEGLKANGKLFAMVVRGRLVVKLPAGQAAALIADGEAVAFEPRPGRMMKEWVAVEMQDAGGTPPDAVAPGAGGRWRELVADAGNYVAALSRPARK